MPSKDLREVDDKLLDINTYMLQGSILALIVIVTLGCWCHRLQNQVDKLRDHYNPQPISEVKGNL